MTDTRPVTAEQVLRRIDWQVIRPLEGRYQGDHRTLHHGIGLDFTDLREYQADDDVRHIDWNVTARLDQPHVRQYVEDREITAWLVVDRSRSMHFGPGEAPGEATKAMAAAELVGSLARVLTKSGNRVGLLTFSDGVDTTVLPKTGRTHVLRLLHELLRPAPAAAVPTDLGDVLTAAARAIRRRSLIFVISDWVSPDGWERPLRSLTSRHDVVAIRIVDRDDGALPDAGVIVIEDAETGEQLTVDTSDPGLRERFAAVVAERERSLRHAARLAGVDLARVEVGEDLIGALLRLAELRRARR